MTTPFARLELLLGPDALPRLANARVVIAGLGTVGAARRIPRPLRRRPPRSR